MTPDCEALARLIDPRAFDVINGGLREIMRRDQTLYAAARIIAAGWAPVVVHETLSDAQQVTDEMVEAALTEWFKDWDTPGPHAMRKTLEAALAASEPAPSITSLPDPTPAEKVPAGPVAFCFVPGVLYIDKHGNGHFQFDAADLDFCPHDDKEGSYVQIRVEASEIEAMRELLNERAMTEGEKP